MAKFKGYLIQVLSVCGFEEWISTVEGTLDLSCSLTPFVFFLERWPETNCFYDVTGQPRDRLYLQGKCQVFVDNLQKNFTYSSRLNAYSKVRMAKAAKM